MTSRTECPLPPANIASGTLRLHTLTPDDSLYRICRGSDPVSFSLSSRGNRFDPLASPWHASKALYAASSPEAAISETVLRWQDRIGAGGKILLSRSQITGRTLVGLQWGRPLEVLDFTGFGLKALAELVTEGRAEDIFLAGAASYGRCQHWGSLFRSAYPNAAGFRWMSRHYNSSYCYVFYDESTQPHGFRKILINEALERGTAAFSLLEKCVTALSWELES